MEISLYDLPCGQEGLIKRLKGNEGFKKKLATLNIRVGKNIRKITRQPFNGPVVIEIENTEATIGINMAKKIILEPLKTE